MSEIRLGTTVPDFELSATGAKTLRLSELRGRNVLLYFYPKADTPGCTQEGADFRDRYADFVAANTVILGVSRDNLKAQQNFKDKYGFPFELLCDTQQELCERFAVLKEKNHFGRKALGVERSTFLLDASGVLRREWRGVKVRGHADEVLQAAKELTE
ncbi:peroxiredoxin [Nitrococcus mobilis]|uniref:thioredoxin-dependent peroxiredoxin n=1 Tax=Nitrococcus mobilis Nb-231 TaxID=314278 RepID=A4BPM9_9GAMM|nr:peroxiredoxin [Nitrococcus mobilis]EAR22530.1 Peroxiredoxin [Nitrococcus mobilis Nb-231]